MRKRKFRAERDRVGHYLWLLHQCGEEDAAQFFPDVHRQFASTAERSQTHGDDSTCSGSSSSESQSEGISALPSRHRSTTHSLNHGSSRSA